MSLLVKPNHAVRLSVLNPALRERVEKFDTGNDGELDINESMQGLITLQKQSNNYKKMIWLLIPVLCLVLAGSFGTTILAINLTKEIHQNSGILTSKMDNTPIRTVSAVSKDLMFSSMFSEDYNMISKLHFGNVVLNVNDIYQLTLSDDTKTVYINSDMLYFGLNQTGSYLVNYNQGYETNPIAQMMYQTVNNSLSEYSLIVNYYLSTFGVQPTLDTIQQYTSQYTVITNKVPEDYSVSDNSNILSSNLVTSTSRMASVEMTDSDVCSQGSFYSTKCKSQDCYECTFINDEKCCGLPSQWQSCNLTPNGAGMTNCKKVN
jgi:hypothetical protein